MKVDLTDEELTTIMAALEGYRDLMKDRFHLSEDRTALRAASSAEWCWQKLLGFQHDSRNSTTDAAESEKSSTSIDPYDLSGLE